jgi:hypothetical protein
MTEEISIVYSICTILSPLGQMDLTPWSSRIVRHRLSNAGSSPPDELLLLGYVGSEKIGRCRADTRTRHIGRHQYSHGICTILVMACKLQ